MLTSTTVVYYNKYMNNADFNIQEFRRQLRRLEAEIGMTLAGETACCGVTLAQCHLLLEMENREAPSLTELADALALDKSTLSRTLDSLVRDGLVEREPDPDNRRRLRLAYTPAGRERVQYINDLCNCSWQNILTLIPVQKQPILAEAITLLARAMRTHRQRGSEPCCR